MAADCSVRTVLVTALAAGLASVAALSARGEAGAGEGDSGAGSSSGGPPAAVRTGGLTGDAVETPPAVPVHPDTLEFRHRDHRGVDCVACHASDDTHGGLSVERPADCHECHHRSDDAPACARCHSDRDLRGEGHGLRRPLELSTGTAPERPLAFDHADHDSAGCRDCHTEGPELSARNVACADCHEDHHRPESRCAACHVDPPDDVHPVAVAHVTCAGSGCHASLPFDRVPRSRQACLSCHQDLTEHRPGRPCAECHALPRREPGAGEAPSAGEDR
jgi:hypothetical protein